MVDRPRSAFFLLLSGQAPRLAGRLETPLSRPGPERDPITQADKGASLPRPGCDPVQCHAVSQAVTHTLLAPQPCRPAGHGIQHAGSGLGGLGSQQNGPPRGLHAIWTRLACGRPATFSRGKPTSIQTGGRIPVFVFRDFVLSSSHVVRSSRSNPTETLCLISCFARNKQQAAFQVVHTHLGTSDGGLISRPQPQPSFRPPLSPSNHSFRYLRLAATSQPIVPCCVALPTTSKRPSFECRRLRVTVTKSHEHGC